LGLNLREALQKAKPSEDVVFFSTERRGDSIVPSKAGVAGRVFVANNQLNLIIGTARLEYLAYLNNYKKMPNYTEGSRGVKGAAVLQADNASLGAAGRSDWLVWDLTGAPAQATMPVVDNQPKAPAAPAAAAVNNDVAAAQEQRLKRLQRLHDQGLITDQEYQAKRQEILKEL
jgi:hypothetical protein